MSDHDSAQSAMKADAQPSTEYTPRFKTLNGIQCDEYYALVREEWRREWELEKIRPRELPSDSAYFYFLLDLSKRHYPKMTLRDLKATWPTIDGKIIDDYKSRVRHVLVEMNMEYIHWKVPDHPLAEPSWSRVRALEREEEEHQGRSAAAPVSTKRAGRKQGCRPLIASAVSDPIQNISSKAPPQLPTNAGRNLGEIQAEEYHLATQEEIEEEEKLPHTEQAHKLPAEPEYLSFILNLSKGHQPKMVLRDVKKMWQVLDPEINYGYLVAVFKILKAIDLEYIHWKLPKDELADPSRSLVRMREQEEEKERRHLEAETAPRRNRPLKAQNPAQSTPHGTMSEPERRSSGRVHKSRKASAKPESTQARTQASTGKRRQQKKIDHPRKLGRHS